MNVGILFITTIIYFSKIQRQELDYPRLSNYFHEGRIRLWRTNAQSPTRFRRDGLFFGCSGKQAYLKFGEGLPAVIQILLRGEI